MTNNVEDLLRDAQIDVLEEMSRRLVHIVESDGDVSPGEAVRNLAREMGIVESQAKFGLTYAKAKGKLKLDRATRRLSVSQPSYA